MFYQSNKIPDLFATLSSVEVGKHLYWTIGSYRIHGQVFLVSWLVIFTLITIAFLGTRNLQRAPQKFQNFMEFILEFLQDIAKNQIGEKEYRFWVPYI